MMPGPLDLGDVVGGRYKVVGYVGAGGMQFVYAAEDQLIGRVVALKTPQNNSAVKRFKRSAILAARVNHPHVAKTLDYLVENDTQFLAEELIDGNDLSKALLKRTAFLDPYLVARILHHLSRGVAVAHHANVVHRDLKPTNVMVSGGYSLTEVKITDFGIAKLASETLDEAIEGGEESISMSQTAVGALPYMAPEAIDKPKETTSAVDIWSIGAMTFELLTGVLPFGNGLRAVHRILNGEVAEVPKFVIANPQFSPLATELLSIIHSCMSSDPKARPTADQLAAQCGVLCYPLEERSESYVRKFMYGKYGFINGEVNDTFFNIASVYGDVPGHGDDVLFARFDGIPAPRAHPVMKLKPRS